MSVWYQSKRLGSESKDGPKPLKSGLAALVPGYPDGIPLPIAPQAVQGGARPCVNPSERLPQPACMRGRSWVLPLAVPSLLGECAHGEAESELHFLVERRGNVEDAELRVVFRRVCDGRSNWERALGFSIEFIDKKANLAGLQVADLVSTPIGRHVHRPEQLNRAFEMIRKKFWCSPDGEQRGWGFEVFP